MWLHVLCIMLIHWLFDAVVCCSAVVQVCEKTKKTCSKDPVAVACASHPGHPLSGYLVYGYSFQTFRVLSLCSLSRLQYVLVVDECLSRRFPVRWSVCRHASHPRVDKGEVSEHRLVNAVDERPVSTRQPGLLVNKLFVKVAAVARRCLQKQRGNISTHAMTRQILLICLPRCRLAARF